MTLRDSIVSTKIVSTFNSLHFDLQLQSVYTQELFSKSLQNRQSHPNYTSMVPKLTLPTIDRYQSFPYCLNLLKNIHKHMLKHLNGNKLLHPSQSGFRENHSCQTALTHPVDHRLHNINNSRFNGVLFVDFRKAFDVTSHDLLLRKLPIYGVSSSTLAFLSSYIAERQRCVYAPSRRSTLLRLKYGVPQGSVIVPLLSSIYVSD